jgi:DNA primase
MRFPPQFLDELRARLPASEVVGRRVKLTRAGREWKGLSPFNQEKTPSFFVNDQKMAWFDFSSGKNGNIFDFVMLTEGLSFPEAVEKLAGEAGLPLPKVDRESLAREEKRKSLHDVMEMATAFFEQSLQARVGARARGYLADRRIAPETQLGFRLGYAPGERFALKEYLGGKGVPVEDMVEAGLLIAGDDIPVPYDRFRDRVMFPITDMRGRIIAFGGRAMEKDVPAKYLNSPETPLFHKGHNLYNGAAARAATQNGARLIAVEGYVDVIALVAAGFRAAVAPLGTAMTEDQLGLLWKMSEEPVLCFDGDKAGQRAAYRALDLALPSVGPGRSLVFARLPEGQDPDDLIRAEGRGAMEDVLKGARPLADMLWQRETESGGFDTPERRAALEARLKEAVSVIRDETVKKHYRADMEARIAALFQPLRAAARAPMRRDQGRSGRGRPGERFGDAPVSLAPLSPHFAASALVRGARTAIAPRDALILTAIIHHPWLAERHAEDLADLDMRQGDLEALKSALIDITAHGQVATRAEMTAALTARGLEALLLRLEAAVVATPVWGVLDGAAPEDVELTFGQLVALQRQALALSKELKDAEQALGSDPTDANFGWLKDVKERMARIEGMEALVEGFGVASGRRIGVAL